MRKIIIGIAIIGLLDSSSVQAKYENVSDLSTLSIDDINQEDEIDSLKQLYKRSPDILKTISKEEKLSLFSKKNNPRYRKATEIQNAIEARIVALERKATELKKIQNYTGGATLTKQFTNLSNIFNKIANTCMTLALNVNTFNIDNNIDAIMFASSMFQQLGKCLQSSAQTNEHIVKATIEQSKSKARGDKFEIEARSLFGISNELYEALSHDVKIFSSMLKLLSELSYKNLNNVGNIIQSLNKSQSQIQKSQNLREHIDKLKYIKSSDEELQKKIDVMLDKLIQTFNVLNEVSMQIIPSTTALMQDNDSNLLQQIIEKTEDVISNDEFSNTSRNNQVLSSRRDNNYNNSSNRNNRNTSLRKTRSSSNLTSSDYDFDRETMRRSRNRTTLFSQQGYED